MNNSGESHALWGYISGGLTFISPFAFFIHSIIGWIFVVITVFSYIYSIILFIKSKSQKHPHKNENNSTVLPYSINNESSFLDKPTPKEIESQIKNQPLYLQEKAYSAYIGIHIHWIMFVISLKVDNKSKNANIYFDNFIQGSINAKKYPQIKTIKQGDKCEIWAEIINADSTWICLKIHHLKLL